jgi:hypothetical protein
MRSAEAPRRLRDPRDDQSRPSRPRSRAASVVRTSGAAAIGVLSLLLNPLFVAPAVAVAALISRRRRR